MEDGTLRELQLYEFEALEPSVILEALESLRTLTVDVGDHNIDQELARSVEASPRLQELNISLPESHSLERIVKILEIWQDRSHPLQLTLLERDDEGRGYIVARALVGSHVHSRLVTSNTDFQQSNGHPVASQWRRDIPATIEFLQWNCDDVSTPLTDFTAALLDMATKLYPSVLTSVSLDISHVSLEGLPHLQSILQRSVLKCLHIVCTKFDPSLSDFVRHVLLSVQWPSVQSLILSGEAVNEWIQILAPTFSDGNSTSSTSPLDLQLQCLWIQGSGNRPLCLSHSSVLFIHQIVYPNSPMELVLENVCMQGGRDSDLLPGSVCSYRK
ncbi:hypothetical protein BGZ82_003251 [Podila clonocystis]|nr:hypothetical protein BGZ82_003251 [Podila clonocystis]